MNEEKGDFLIPDFNEDAYFLWAVDDIPPFEVSKIPLDHQCECVAYKISENSKSLLFVTDHEARNNEINKNLIEKGKGVDLLIHDGSFSEEEYAINVGWGHSSFPRAVENARQMGVSHLVLFCHDRDHTDSEIDAFVEEANQLAKDAFKVSGAKEGRVYEV